MAIKNIRAIFFTIDSLLAAGIILAYVMPNEPVSEIMPGLGFALLAGYPVKIMQEDGLWVRFDPAQHGRQERVRALVAACTPGLAQDLVKLIASA